RTSGVMRGVLSSAGGDPRELVEKARAIPSMQGQDVATRVSTKTRYEWDQPVESCSPSEDVGQAPAVKFHVVAYDFGIKRNILRRLRQVGCKTTVVPAGTTAEDVLGLNPDGIFLSNGPGDPEPLAAQAAEVRKLVGKKPMFGICLGHQVLGLALGGKSFKLKFGHRGANHPVLHYHRNKVEITSQNHGFAIDPESLDSNQIELTHINLNDQTLEGF
ncbi:MAG: carbamoyl phosphate synthase small subunit, partial [bacterium]|nr:carbamoyl phosphate synthase small subunit [bacterium]